jgi:hypothetical protein
LPQFESRCQAGSQRAFGQAEWRAKHQGRAGDTTKQRSKSALRPGTRPRMYPAGLVRQILARQLGQIRQQRAKIACHVHDPQNQTVRTLGIVDK